MPDTMTDIPALKEAVVEAAKAHDAARLSAQSHNTAEMKLQDAVMALRAILLSDIEALAEEAKR